MMMMSVFRFLSLLSLTLTLVGLWFAQLVEDKRDELVVVLAGCPAEMDELMAHNPGVRSRFPTVRRP